MRLRSVLPWLALAASISAAALLLGQTAPEGLNLVATTANVANAPEPVRFEITRWSSDQERDRLLAAYQLRSNNTKGGDKGDKGGKGKAGGRGPAPETNDPITPDVSLAKALEGAPTVGYIWSSEISGYAIRYAGRVTSADGSQRVILITQRRLGAVNQRWNPATGTPNKLEFSVIELRLNSINMGEGKASLTGTIGVDATAKIVAPSNYESLPVTFKDVKPAPKRP